MPEGENPIMTLERELETFRRLLPHFLHQQGKYMLVQGEQVAGVFGSWEEASKAGHARFGLASFLIKKIEETETPVVTFFGRAMYECLS